MLRVEHLYKNYQTGSQTYPVLRDVSFEVEKGEFVAVMGPSGSGKSTLLNCIACYIPFQKGEIVLGGQNLASLDAEGLAAVRNRKLGFVFQDFCLLDGLSVKDNILLPRIISGQTEEAMEEDAARLCRIFGIEHIRDKYPAEISGGEKQRTAVARALIGEPKLLILDEPSLGLAPNIVDDILNVASTLAKNDGISVLLVEQDITKALAAADRGYVIENGRIALEGTSAELQANEHVKKAYLGI